MAARVRPRDAWILALVLAVASFVASAFIGAARGSAEALLAVGVLRVVLGACLVLVVPGFALTAALFPPGSLAKTVRLTLGAALSLIVAVMGGLILNCTPWGLRQESWVAFLSSSARRRQRWRALVGPRRGLACCAGMGRDSGPGLLRL